jgi:hypothetical protein
MAVMKGAKRHSERTRGQEWSPLVASSERRRVVPTDTLEGDINPVAHLP